MGKGLEGKGLEGKGLEGKGLEGKGLEGKGLEGKGRGSDKGPITFLWVSQGAKTGHPRLLISISYL
jgi:hypothetical protein